MEYLYITLFIVALFSLAQLPAWKNLKERYYYPITIVGFAVFSSMILYNKFSFLKLGLLLVMFTATIAAPVRKDRLKEKVKGITE